MTERWTIFAIALMLVASCVEGCFQESTVKGERMSKVSQELIHLYDEYAKFLASGQSVGFKSSEPALQVIDDRVLVDAVASGDATVLKSDLETLGMQRAVAYGRVVSGQLPIAVIRQTERLRSLNSIRGSSPVLQGIPGSTPPKAQNR